MPFYLDCNVPLVEKPNISLISHLTLFVDHDANERLCRLLHNHLVKPRKQIIRVDCRQIML